MTNRIPTQIDRNRVNHLRAERSWREPEPYDWQADTVIILPVDPTPTPASPFPAIDAGEPQRAPRVRYQRPRPAWGAVGGIAGVSWLLGVLWAGAVTDVVEELGRWMG